MKLIAQALMVKKKKNLNDNPTSTTFWTERKKKKISSRNLIHYQSTASLAEWSLVSNLLRLENDAPIMGSMWKFIYMVYIGSKWPLQLYNKYLWYHIFHD